MYIINSDSKVLMLYESRKNNRSEDSMIDRIEEIEKADLHIHLNGAIPSDVIREIIIRNEIVLPCEFNIQSNLQILSSVRSLKEYFKPWIAFKSIPIGYEMLETMVCATFRKLKSDKITYVEFRNSPFYISRLNDISLEKVLHWLVEAISINSKIWGIDAKLILSITKHEYDYNEAVQLINAIKNINSDRIVGMDMSGIEDVEVDSSVVKIFRRAKNELGLGISIHAGETGNEHNIEWAIKQCQADRIGHGTAALKSKKVIELIKEKNVCIEISIISNLRTNSVKNIETHPILDFIKNEIPVVLCTDNPAVHGSTLSDEYKILNRLVSDEKIIKHILNNGKEYSFRRK